MKSKATNRRENIVDANNVDTFLRDKGSHGAPGGLSFAQAVKVLGVSTCCGVVFGVSLEKGRVFEPSVIRDQMMFNKFIMLKMFVSAVGSGMFCMSCLAMLPATKSKFLQAGQDFISKFHNKGLLSSIMGAAILGAGMTVSGACPGMVLVQVGSGVDNSGYTLVGALVGAVVYGLLEPCMVAITKPSQPLRTHTLNQLYGSPYFTVALPLSAVLAVAVFGLELTVPWQSELANPAASGTYWFTQPAWPPYLAGILVGALQIPIILTVGSTLGGSSSYCSLVSQALVTPVLQKASPYLAKYRSGVTNFWQVFYVGGAVLGGYLSSISSNTWGTIPGVQPLEAFLGGALMLIGSRLASGCTSGHGISGVGLLSLLSFAAVPAMFGGAICTAFLMKWTGGP